MTRCFGCIRQSTTTARKSEHYISSSTEAPDRDIAIDRFNDPTTMYTALPISLKLSGYGVNLHYVCPWGIVVETGEYCNVDRISATLGKLDAAKTELQKGRQNNQNSNTAKTLFLISYVTGALPSEMTEVQLLDETIHRILVCYNAAQLGASRGRYGTFLMQGPCRG